MELHGDQCLISKPVQPEDGLLSKTLLQLAWGKVYGDSQLAHLLQDVGDVLGSSVSWGGSKLWPIFLTSPGPPLLLCFLLFTC